MKRYSNKIKLEARRLRASGNTYSEIKSILNISPTKSTLSFWLKDVVLPPNYKEKVKGLNESNLKKARYKAFVINRNKRQEFFKNIRLINNSVVKGIRNINTAKIALAMLCLGEASKYNPKTTANFYLGSSNPKIILLFLQLLKCCYDFKQEKVRCTVQCRADQDIKALQKYWQKITGIPKSLFYKTRIDPRTKGKPTKISGYKGVLRVDYFDRKIQLELESLANLIYNKLCVNGLVA